MRADELLIRSAVIQKMASGWAIVGPFHLPDTVPGAWRIGKPKPKTPIVEDTLEGTQIETPVGAGPVADDTPMVVVELLNTQSTVLAPNSQDPIPTDVTPEAIDRNLV